MARVALLATGGAVKGETLCTRCGHSHDVATRLRLLEPMRDLEAEAIREVWPCFYRRGEAGERMLTRDLARLRRAA